MNFSRTSVPDVWLIDMQRHVDQRGWFARGWCEEEFAQMGLTHRVAQLNIASNRQAGTLRGLHFQSGGDWEAKVIRVLHGAALIAAVDLRPASPTYLQHVTARLDRAAGQALFVPVGFAQGYQTLADDTELLYLMSTPFQPEAAAGYRFDDPAFGIKWPLPVAVMSDKDKAWPPYGEQASD